MTRKVNLAIFDNDLRAKVGKYPVSDDGTKIRVVSGGENHHMPSFDNDSFIEFPYRAFSSFWTVSYKRVYFVKGKGKKCIDFKGETVTIFPPDPEALKRANLNLLATKIGKDTNQGTPWYIWAILISTLLNLFLVLQMSGVLS